MVACLRDMLLSWDHTSVRFLGQLEAKWQMLFRFLLSFLSASHPVSPVKAHFVGHSFGSIVVAWMCRNAKDTVPSLEM